MTDEARQAAGSGADVTPEMVIGALAEVPQAGRYRFLASVLGALADRDGGGDASGAGDDRLKELSRKLQALAERKADLEDLLATTKADLAHQVSQLEAEQVRAAQKDQTISELRGRLEGIKRERDELASELVDKNAALHTAETEQEHLTLELQRAGMAGTDDSKTDRLEASRRALIQEVEQLRRDHEQLRLDKDTQIETLKDELAHAKSADTGGAEGLLLELWQPLMGAKPAMADRQMPPNRQAAERLVEAFLEIVRFADDLDKDLRVFLDKYTKHNPTVKVPWEVYTQRDDVLATARQTIAAQGGRPVGLLKMRLRVLSAWCQAAMIGADVAVESVASELQTYMLGPDGTQSDPNRTVKDFIRHDGHQLFMQRIRQVRSEKLAEAYGRSG